MCLKITLWNWSRVQFTLPIPRNRALDIIICSTSCTFLARPKEGFISSTLHNHRVTEIHATSPTITQDCYWDKGIVIYIDISTHHQDNGFHISRVTDTKLCGLKIHSLGNLPSSQSHASNPMACSRLDQCVNYRQDDID